MNQIEADIAPDRANASSDTRSKLLFGALVFGVALVVRLVYAAQVSGCPLFQYPTIDAGVYYLLAHDFAQGHWLYPLGEPYWQPPFYSAILGLWMKVGGDSVLSAKHAQFVLGSINCVLIYALTTRLFRTRVGLVAGLMAAFYAPLIYFDGELLTPTVQMFLNLYAILALLRAVDRRATFWIVVAGLLMGFSIVVRPDVAVFVLASAAWAFLALRQNVSPGKAAAMCMLLLFCAALPVVPIAVRNNIVGKDSVLISYNGGLNFYIGNNANYEQTLAVRPGPEWDALAALPLKKAADMKPSAQSSFFYAKSARFIRTRPLEWAKLMLKKSAIYLTAIEGRRNHDMYFMRRYSSVFSVLLFRAGPFAFPLGLVLPLAVIGIMRRPRGRDTSLLLVYIAASCAATVGFFVVARYRVTVVPALLVFAAFGAAELYRMIADRRVVLAPLAVAGLVLVFTNANLPGVDANRRLVDSDSHYFVAGILDGDDKKLQAIPEYNLAIKLNPNYALSRLNYGRMLYEMGRANQAKHQLERALEISRNLPQAEWMLGEIYDRQGDKATARRHYEAAVRLDAFYADGLAQVALGAFNGRDYAYAAGALGIVVEAKPDYSQARHTLGLAFVKLGKLNQAIEQFRKTIELDPGAAEPWLALGIAYHKQGRSAEAKAAFDRAIEIGPPVEMRARVRRYLDED